MGATPAVASIIVYSLCSGTMLLLNKLAVSSVKGAPCAVSVIQFVVAVIFVLGLKATKAQPVDALMWFKIKPYLAYVVSFVLTVWTNMKALEASNVDTVIVFRSCTPLAVAVLDWMFLGRELPGLRSAGSLFLLLAGATGYVLLDAQFGLEGWAAYQTVTAYFVMICVEMTVGKKVVSSVKMESVSGSVLYTNIFAVLPMLAIAAASQEGDALRAMEWTPAALSFLAASCVVGTGISYAGWWCRAQVSATTFTLVGVVNKLLTVLLNVLVWNKHASGPGIACLLVCLVGGGIYKQSPMRPDGAGADAVGGAAAADAVAGQHPSDKAGALVKSEEETDLEMKPLIGSGSNRSGSGGGEHKQGTRSPLPGFKEDVPMNGRRR